MLNSYPLFVFTKKKGEGFYIRKNLLKHKHKKGGGENNYSVTLCSIKRGGKLT